MDKHYYIYVSTIKHIEILIIVLVRSNKFSSQSFLHEEIRDLICIRFSFPNLAAAQLLVAVGERWIDIDAVESSNGDTALHLISRSTKSDALPIVELLINARAHLDCLNKHNKTPIDDAKTPEIKSLLQRQQTPTLLKCLCARFIVRKQLNYQSIWPSESKLNTFIYLHGCIAKQN